MLALLPVLLTTLHGAPVTAPTLPQILSSELEREFTLLKAKGDPAPYFLAYEAVDLQTRSVSATLGALVQAQNTHQRGFDTTVRVGSPEFDNYHPARGFGAQFTIFHGISLDDNANEIRRALWSETDRVYRAASRRLNELKTNQQLLADEKEKNADFSAETPQHAASEPEPIEFDEAAWAGRVRAWSREFRSHPKILSSSVGYTAHRDVRTLVDTEGASVQRGSLLYRVEISGLGLASDGMDLSMFGALEATDSAHVPDSAAVTAKVQKVAADLDALIAAPPAEPIVCPAILSGRAAAVFFHEIFGHRMEGHRQKNIAEGQTFTAMLGQPVLPPFLSVLSDPTRRQFNGGDLIGAYDYDDEGVRAQPVTLVEAGVLRTFLLSRSPVGKFVHSNGHGRRQPGHEITSRQSNLIVESSKRLSDAALRAQLVSEIKRQNKPYGLYFEEVSSGFTTTGRAGLQAFSVVPLIVYRVFPDSRPDELIRGVNIVGTPLASFQKILATSDRAEVFNGFCGAESGSVPVSAVAPAILVSEIETEKKQNSQQRNPILPRPEAGQ